MSEERNNMVDRFIRNITYMAFGVICGVTWLKADLGTTAAELISQDSVQVQSTAEYTQELKNEASLFIKTHTIIDANGCPTAEWLQFKSDQRTIAKRRGNTSSYLPDLSWMQSLKFW